MYNVHKYLQGPPCLSVQSNLALTDKDMDAKNVLKVILKSWDYEFCEMLTVRPLLDAVLVNPSFENKFLIFDQFYSFFKFVISL